MTKRAAAYIRSHIRAAWRWYDENRKLVKKSARCCKTCGSTTNLHVDHAKPVGHFDIGDVDGYIKRMFCPKSNLQVLCAKCNLKKRDK